MTPMIALYSIVEEGGNLKSMVQNLDIVMIRIAVQTIECGVFIQQHTSNTGGWADADSEARVSVFYSHLSVIN